MRSFKIYPAVKVASIETAFAYRTGKTWRRRKRAPDESARHPNVTLAKRSARRGESPGSALRSWNVTAVFSTKLLVAPTLKLMTLATRAGIQIEKRPEDKEVDDGVEHPYCAKGCRSQEAARRRGGLRSQHHDLGLAKRRDWIMSCACRSGALRSDLRCLGESRAKLTGG